MKRKNQLAKHEAPETPEADITLENIGPVDFLRLSLKPGGGVVQLVGDNGAGKSESLAAIASVLKGEGKPAVEVSDGADRGEINVMGAVLRVGKSSRRIGELAVQSLEGRFDISDLAAPPLKDPAAADRLAIKALVSLSGVKASVVPFVELLGSEEFNRLVPQDSLQTDDPVEMAARVKRAIETAARVEEKAEAHERAQAEAMERLLGEVTEGTETDEATLLSNLEAAVSAVGAIESRMQEAELTAARIKRAEGQLEESGKGMSGAKEAYSAKEDAERAKEAAAQKVVDLEQALAVAKAEMTAACNADRAAKTRVAEIDVAAKLHAEARERLKAAVAVSAPGDDEIEASHKSLADARAAHEAGVRARDARQRVAEVDRVKRLANRHASAASKLRDAAGECDGILTGMVSSSVLSVKTVDGNARLVLATKRSKQTFYRDLSDGERYDVAIRAAVERLPKGGILVLRQTAWQDLAPKKRVAVDALAQKLGVHIITALVDDGELRPEQFGNVLRS